MSLKKETLAFTKTGILSPLIADYVAAKPSLNKFYSYKPELNSFGAVIENRKKFKTSRKELVQVLLQQNSNLPDNHAVIKNIESLAFDTTFTVTTGHQLCVFTGPLYFIYKLLSTINLAESISEAYPDYNIVPVYWMASEDHDFEEISSINIYGKKIEWKYDAKGPSGELPTESMGDLLTELKSVMGESDTAKELYHLFEEAYMFNATLSDAMRFLVHKLMGQYGLVVIDANDAVLKRLYIPVLKDELENQSSFSLVDATSKELTDLGYKPQVNPRNVNLFFIEEGLRERIVRAPDGHFEVVNTDLSFTSDIFLDLLNMQPERFSPNVVLRPLYQEYILPNLAYVGGPGELSYWLQYKSMFDYHKVPFPVLMPRSSVLLLDHSVTKKMDQLGIAAGDLFLAADDLIKQYIDKSSTDKFDSEKERAAAIELFKSLREKVVAIDQSLGGTVGAEEQKLLNSIDIIEKKVIAAIKRKNDTVITQLRNLKEKIFPNGVLQERYVNFIPWYNQYGQSFISLLKLELTPFTNELIILGLE